MTRTRMVLAGVMFIVAAASLYLAIEGDTAHAGLQRGTQLLLVLAWLAFAVVLWRERRANV